MSIDPTESMTAAGKKRYAIQAGTTQWGDHLNNSLADIDNRLEEIEIRLPETSQPHPAAGIVAGGITAAAIAVSASKPVSRRSMFNVFRRKP